MKYLIAFVLLTPIFFISQNSFAMAPKIDSVYADSVYDGIINGALGITAAIASLGKPDSNYATFNNSTSTLDLGFRNHAHTTLLPIKANSIVIIWGKKDPSVDTSAAQVIFVQAASDGSIIRSTKPIVFDVGPKVIIVPPGEFTYMEFSLAGSEKGGGAKSYLLDAVALVQDTTPVVSVSPERYFVNSISSYPNPFFSNTTIHFDLQIEGEVQLSVIDALGREVDRLNAGFLEAGVHETPIVIKSAGLYFIRLFLNGQPAGSPLKITSR